MRTSSRAPARAPEPRARRQPRGTVVGLAAALGLLTAALYAPVGYHAFLHFDDPEYVTGNRHVTAGLTAAGFVWAWTGVHQASWHPLTSLSHMLDCQLFGLRPGPPHVVNAALHVLNTVLLFGVLLRMTGQPFPSACVAALFGVHPLHVESVAWVSERKDVLSTFFALLTLWAYTTYVRCRSAARYGLVLAAYVAALLSKPMVVSLPGVLLLLDVWPLRRLGGASAEPATSARTAKRRNRGPVRSRVVTAHEGARTTGQVAAVGLSAAVLEKLPLLVLAGIVSVITVIAQRHAGAVMSLGRFSVADRAANALVAYAAYVGKMLWPSRLAIYYPFEAPLPLWQVLGAAAFLGATTAAVLWDWRRHAYLFTGWLWYVGTLLPVIGLVQVGEQAMADRYTYIPSIGIFIIAAWGVPDLFRKWRLRQVGCAVAAGLAIAACTVLTVRQLALWGDEVQLFQHTLAVTRNNWLAHHNLGITLDRQGKTEEAIAHFREAVREAPNYAEAHLALGEALTEQVKIEQTLGLARQLWAEAQAPADVANDRRAPPEAPTSVRADARTAEAKVHIITALQLKPDYAEAHANLGGVLFEQGQVPEAISHYETALRLQPEYASAHRGLGMVRARQGETAGAVAELQAAVRLNPSDAEARRELEQIERAPQGTGE